LCVDENQELASMVMSEKGTKHLRRCLGMGKEPSTCVDV
jgi:hypothetical protein